jgi:hypothetical protein
MKMRHTKPRPSARSISVVVEPSDQQRLQSFFRQELRFYNTVIGIFESRVRAFPQTILNITPSQAALFGDLAKHNLNIRQLIKAPNAWPEELKHHFSTVFDRLTLKPILSEATLMMFEAVGRERWVVIPETKRQLALSALDFFKEQADILGNPQQSDLIEVSYRAAPSSLSQLEIANKRHTQIPREAIRYKYNNTDDLTEILTPYTAKPIIIPSFNLNEFKHWSTMIIKQESGRWIDHNTPWVIDLKNTNNRYLLKYLDSNARTVGKYRISSYS